MRAFKTSKAALKAAANQPIVKVGRLFIVGIEPLTEIMLLAPNGEYAGQVTAHHLNRLGNANHASEGIPMWSDAFSPETNYKRQRA